MSKGIYVIGTDTEVGKTVVSAGLMHLLMKKKVGAAYFKPVASGDADVNGIRQTADPAFVSAISGFSEDPALVTPYAFADAIAPHLAARLSGRRIDPSVVAGCLAELKARYELIIAEGAGGLAVPLDDEGYMQHAMISRMGFPVLLVARAGLGTINHTLLTLSVARQAGLSVKAIIINGAGQTLIEQDNIAMIRKLSCVDAVFVLPPLTGVDTQSLQAGNLRDVFEQAVDIDDIIALMDRV
ncbi:MAG: dethiobiotin synthase [Smithellaceae bacterium]